MNEKRNLVITGIVCFVLGGIGTGITAGYVVHGQSAGEIAWLNQRYNSLNREYTERQRIIESNVGECLGYVESARGIVERTGENAKGAVKNLREAVALIGAGIEERENLEMELNNLRSALRRIGDVGGVEVE